MTLDTTNLPLHCPFCGSSLISDGEVLSEVNGNTFAQSECLECGALGPKGETVGPDYGDERAIAAWNLGREAESA